MSEQSGAEYTFGRTMTDRRKVLTASEERKTKATSGSRMIATVPFPIRDANRFGLAFALSKRYSSRFLSLSFEIVY